MGKRKTGKGKGFTNKSGVKVSTKLLDDYKKAVKNYNTRIRNLEKKYGSEDFIPARISSERIHDFNTTQAIRNYIKDIDRIRFKNIELVELPSGEKITKVEYDVIKEQIDRENRRRKQQKKKVKGIEENVGYFRTDQEKMYNKIDINKFKSLQSLRKRVEDYANDRLVRLANEWKQRYIDKLDYNISLALIAGIDPSSDIIEKMIRIKGYIESLDSLDKITKASHASPAMDITITSDEVYLQQNIDEIYEAWDSFIDSI